MSEEEHIFAVGPAGELQKKYGWYVENWTPPNFDLSIVPENIRDLIPLAVRWGITCDVTRHDAAGKATDEELQEVSSLLKGRHFDIYDFLYTEFGNETPDEVAAFQALLVFEMEEAGGPGIPGLLDWRIRKYKAHPSDDTMKKLREACQEVSTWDDLFKKHQPLDEAKALIEA